MSERFYLALRIDAERLQLCQKLCTRLIPLWDQLLLLLLSTVDLLQKRITLPRHLRQTVAEDFLVNDSISDALDLCLQVPVSRANRLEQPLGQFIECVCFK